MAGVMSIAEIGDVLAEYVQIGYAQAVKAYDEPKDRIRRSGIKSWLKYNDYDARVFERLVDNGMICARRMGTARNSPLYYSKEEIKRAFGALKVKRLMDGMVMDE